MQWSKRDSWLGLCPHQLWSRNRNLELIFRQLDECTFPFNFSLSKNSYLHDLRCHSTRKMVHGITIISQFRLPIKLFLESNFFSYPSLCCSFNLFSRCKTHFNVYKRGWCIATSAWNWPALSPSCPLPPPPPHPDWRLAKPKQHQPLWHRSKEVKSLLKRYNFISLYNSSTSVLGRIWSN